MPTVNLNRKEVERLVGKKIPIEELKDRISMLGTDLEKVTDNEITVEIFPNRPDMLSEQGFARALSSFLKVKTGLRTYKTVKSNYKVIIHPSVSKVRPHTVCAVVKNLICNEENLKSIIQIQEKLHKSYGRNRKKVAIGIYPLEKITFPITYTAKPPREIIFIPLDGKKELTAEQILQQHPTGKEYAHLLEGEKIYPIFQDSKNNILSMPPIINSETVGKVTTKTKDVFIECSGFDNNTLSKCLNIIITSLADMNGIIYEVTLEGSTSRISPDLQPTEISLDIPYANKILGLQLKEQEIKQLLERMGYGYEKKKVLVPSYRADILHQIDIIEDIAIAYGYENFQETIPNVATIGQESKQSLLNSKITEVLTGFGLLECNTVSLSNEQDLNRKMNLKNQLVEVESPVNTEYNILRNSMIPTLLKVLSENKHHEYPQNLFEIGKIFDDVQDKDSLGITITENFTKIKQTFEAVAAAFAWKYEIIATEHPSFIPGRVGKILVDGKELGVLGELHPEVLEHWNIETTISALELDVDAILKQK